MAPTKGTKPSTTSKKSKSKLSTLTLDSFPSGRKRATPASTPSSSIISENNTRKPTKPLTSLRSFVKPPALPVNEKGKDKMHLLPQFDVEKSAVEDDQLWVDKYTPQTEPELAVHKRKVEDVRRWLTEAFDGGPTGVLKKYRRILALTGHAGTGKTATLRVLAQEMNFDILEWCNSLDDNFSGEVGDDEYDRESLIKKFQTFLTRASSCRPLLLSSNSASSSTTHYPARQVILLEDLPNILHAGTAEAFHAALEDYLISYPGVPLVCIISDAGTRGEDPDSDLGGRSWGKWGKQALDVRSVIPPNIFNSPYFQEVQFNPIASTIMMKALTALMTKHFSASKAKGTPQPTKDTIQMIVDSAHGDIRSAVMALQFACIVQLPKGNKKGGMRSVLEAVTRREQSLALFHMLGKVMYNKRKGDPPSSSTTRKDREREEEFDSSVPDSPPLPIHLQEHSRRSSRVDVNTLYADSPVDTSLFALYLHQNYTQFCNEVDECNGVCDWLSWIDASGPESWQAQQNPHQFHILTLGTLHSLPSPVPRRSQKMYKPDFFDVLKKTREAEGSVADTEEWLNSDEAGSGRKWAKDEVVLELGGLLKALDDCTTGAPPRTHRKFTTLSFVHPAKLPSNLQRMEQLGESEEPYEESIVADITSNARTWAGFKEREDSGGWLENDDIQEF